MLVDAHFMSIADRSILACWGVSGGKAGQSFSVTVDPGGPNERAVDALADAEEVAAGEVIRIRTTGGGGWGDPLTRPPAEVLKDIKWHKVSVGGAARDYGVVIVDGPDGPAVDEPGTVELRTRLAAAASADPPFFDRGPGYPKLAGGRAFAEVDLLKTSSHA
jgi:N-methylhydantoinase B